MLQILNAGRGCGITLTPSPSARPLDRATAAQQMRCNRRSSRCCSVVSASEGAGGDSALERREARGWRSSTMPSRQKEQSMAKWKDAALHFTKK